MIEYEQPTVQEGWGKRLIDRVHARVKRFETNHPDSVYTVSMKRFYTIRDRLPENLQTAPGIGWLESEAIAGGLGKQIGTWIGDAVWNTVSFPFTVGDRHMQNPFSEGTKTEERMPDIVATLHPGIPAPDRPPTGSLNLRVTDAGFSRIG